MFALDKYKIEGQNKITFFYTVQFVSTLNKRHSNVLITVCIVSHYIHISNTQII